MMFVCVCSWGGLVQDVWVKSSLEEARLSLAKQCLGGTYGSFDPGADDARVFEVGDDGVGIEVYSYDETDFEVIGEGDEQQIRFIEHRFAIIDRKDGINFDGEIYLDLQTAQKTFAELQEGGELSDTDAVAEIDGDGDVIAFADGWFVYQRLLFKPIRIFEDREDAVLAVTNCCRNTGLTPDGWDCDAFYEAAKRAGSGQFDVFEMNNRKVIPSTSYLFDVENPA